MNTQLFGSLVWSGAGFLIGFLTCWVSIQMSSAKRVGGDRVNVSRESRMDVLRSVLGVVILLLLGLTAVKYYTTTSCQHAYNKAVAEALNQRSEAQRDQGLAQVRLLTATLSPDRSLGIAATRDYINAITELERVRAANPLPSPPDCGGF